MSSYLPVRLTRETPFKSQLGCTAGIAIVLLAVAALAWFAAKSEGKGSNWVGYVVCAGFGFFGLLLLPRPALPLNRAGNSAPSSVTTVISRRPKNAAFARSTFR